MSILDEIKIKSEYIGHSYQTINDKQYYQDHWKVKISFHNKQMTTPFFQGSALAGSEPLLKDVLHCLISDYQALEDHSSIEEFSWAFGYEDLKEAEKVWKSMKKSSKQMNKLFEQKHIKELKKIFENY